MVLLTLNADGSYTYVADQDAANSLKRGDSAIDYFNYTVTDGTKNRYWSNCNNS